MNYLLVEVVNRDISTPVAFDTYDDAFDEMCEYFAQVCDLTREQVKTAYANGEYDGEPDHPYLGASTAWADKHGVQFDWQIFDISEFYV